MRVCSSAALLLGMGLVGCQAGDFPVAGTTASAHSSLHYGTISTFAGTGVFGYSGDGGVAMSARLYQPYGLAFDASGDLLVADAADDVVRKVAAGTGMVSTFAGVYPGFLAFGGYSGNGGPAMSARFYGPFGVAVDAGGNVYIADEANNVIRQVSAETGFVSVFAGNGAQAGTGNGTYTGDGGPAVNAGLYHPYKLAFDKSGNLYICDTGNSAIREVNAVTGVITTVAGNGTHGYAGDGGLATSAAIYRPVGIAFDASGNFYFADDATATVRKVNIATGIITTVAGVFRAQQSSYDSGDGGPATQAGLLAPFDVAFDGNGDLIIADDNLVRRVTMATGVIDTIVGTTQGYSGDSGPADKAQVNNVYGLAFDASGNLYLADSANGVVRKVLVTR
jgi:sugar lactone lactonase YvrE